MTGKRNDEGSGWTSSGRPDGGLVYYCFACYATNERERGRCRECGAEISAPKETGYDELLVWALDHPVRSIATNAAGILGARQTRAAATRLRQLATEGSDPYLAAVALRSVVAIEGLSETRDLLLRLRRTAPVLVRATAEKLLGAE